MLLKIGRLTVTLTSAAFAFFVACPPASAQQPAPSAKGQTRSGQPPLATAQPSAPAGPEMPDPYKLNLMIRSAVIALNHANKTGNYTVLQDLAAPSFRASNNSERLAQIFADLRQRNLDLTPILFFTPKLLRQPQILPNGILRLAGYFPTNPERVNFQLYYQMVNKQWRIFGIGVTTSRNDVTAAITPQTRNGAQPANRPPAGAKKPKPAKSETSGPKPAPEKQQPNASRPGLSRPRRPHENRKRQPRYNPPKPATQFRIKQQITPHGSTCPKRPRLKTSQRKFSQIGLLPAMQSIAMKAVSGTASIRSRSRALPGEAWPHETCSRAGWATELDTGLPESALINQQSAKRDRKIN